MSSFFPILRNNLRLNTLFSESLRESKKNICEVSILEVSLFIDGKMIELNEFSQEFLGGTLQGAISPLKGINRNWAELEIKIKR